MATDADSPPQSANTTIDISIIVSVKNIDKLDACNFKYINQMIQKLDLQVTCSCIYSIRTKTTMTPNLYNPCTLLP